MSQDFIQNGIYYLNTPHELSSVTLASKTIPRQQRKQRVKSHVCYFIEELLSFCKTVEKRLI